MFVSIFNEFLSLLQRENLKHSNNVLSVINKDVTYSDRVLYTYKYLKKSSLFPKIQKPTKNNQLAIKYKELGNKEYSKKNLYEALELYNKSIAYAEHECLPIGYGNRSAVLFELNYSKQCEEDIDRALSLNYPASKKDKLIARKEKLQKLKSRSKNYKFFKEIPNIKNPNDVIKCATNKVKLNYNEKYGRHVIATANIEPGEIIAVERPYVSILDKNFSYQLCSYCFNHSLNPIPCDCCTYMLFCDENCKGKAMAAYHKYECQYFSTSIFRDFEGTKALVLVLRIILSARDEFDSIKSLMTYDPRKFGLVDENGRQVLDTNYMGVHYLSGNYDNYSSNEKYSMCILAAIILNILEQIDFCNGNDEIFKICADLALRHLLALKINCHSSFAQKIHEEMIEYDDIGIVFFCFLSLLNHSCSPNVFRIDYGNQKILRAARTIKKGEQIFDCYGKTFNQAPKFMRQMQLTTGYKFECDCDGCKYNWSTSYELDWINTSRNIRLPQVHEIYENLLSSSLTDHMGLIIQRNQKNIINARKNLSKIQKALKLTTKYINYFEYWEFEALLRHAYSMEGNAFWRSK